MLLLKNEQVWFFLSSYHSRVRSMMASTCFMDMISLIRSNQQQLQEPNTMRHICSDLGPVWFYQLNFS